MSFNPNIPQGSDPILQSYTQLKANFQSIDSVFSENHVGLTQDPSTSGMHNFVVFQPQTGDPTTVLNTNVSLYTKTVNSIPQLFFRAYPSATPIQITYQSIQTGLQSTNPPVYYPQQYSFIAGPFLVYAGIIKSVTNGQTVTLSPATTLLSVDITPTNVVYQDFSKLKFSMNVSAISASSFTVQVSTTSVTTIDMYYLAIGN